MHAIIDRAYCLRHPQQVVRSVGWTPFLTTLLRREPSLLGAVKRHHEQHGIPMPGALGRAYRQAAVLEYRMARFYRALAGRFAAQPAASEFFHQMADEEEEHGRLMELCRYTVTTHPQIRYMPDIREGQMAALARRLRRLEARAADLTLEQALQLTEELETSEINAIFDRLLRQVGNAPSRLFADALQAAGEHATAIPLRLAALQRQLLQAA